MRKAGTVPYLRPDGKTQVTFRYENGVPVELTNVVVSTQHSPGINRDNMIRPDLIEQVIKPVIPEQYAEPQQTAKNPRIPASMRRIQRPFSRP